MGERTIAGTLRAAEDWARGMRRPMAQGHHCLPTAILQSFTPNRCVSRVSAWSSLPGGGGVYETISHRKAGWSRPVVSRTIKLLNLVPPALLVRITMPQRRAGSPIVNALKLPLSPQCQK